MTIPDIKIRPAAYDDLEQIFITRVNAGYLKDLHQTPPPAHELYKTYETAEGTKLEKEWATKGVQYFVANAPCHMVEPMIPDHRGKAIAGFCSLRYDTETNPDIFYLENLYAISSLYPTGSLLMAHMMQLAEKSNAHTVRFSAPYTHSQDWYDRLGFKVVASEAKNRKTTTKIMELEIANAHDVLDRLHQKIVPFLTPKPNTL